MQEYKEGALKSGRAGRGGKVKKRKQAIAIALHEAGLSKYDTLAERKRAVAKLKRKTKVKRAKRKVARALVARRVRGGKNATKRSPARKVARRARVARAARTMNEKRMSGGLF
jgi:hypothetical protein